ncbi:hypothetical protein [Gracilibacillus dipsosauri]
MGYRQETAVEEIVTYFRLSDSYSIHRYQEYISHKKNDKLFEI